jgi:large subunit ribosomal protein L10
VKAVSKWPSRGEQLSMLVGQILGPGATLSAQLLSPGRKLASQIKKKGEGEDGTESTPAS